MTTLEVTLTLPDQLAQAGQQLLDAMQRLRDAPGPVLSEADIAAAVKAGRRARGEAGH